MMMKRVYETIDMDNLSVADAIVALQAWETENPDAVESTLTLGWDGDEPYFEIAFQRPMTEAELNEQKVHQANAAKWQEQNERETYERLKAKYEGN